MEAVEKFLQARQDFTVDRDMEKFYLTFNPKGYLKKMV
jgi:cephalosporin hydroxylase